MSVTDIVHDEEIYDNELDMWNEQPADIEKEINSYNNSRTRFLYYPWGVFVTAYAEEAVELGVALASCAESEEYPANLVTVLPETETRPGMLLVYRRVIGCRVSIP